MADFYKSYTKEVSIFMKKSKKKRSRLGYLRLFWGSKGQCTPEVEGHVFMGPHRHSPLTGLRWKGEG